MNKVLLTISNKLRIGPTTRGTDILGQPELELIQDSLVKRYSLEEAIVLRNAIDDYIIMCMQEKNRHDAKVAKEATDNLVKMLSIGRGVKSDALSV